MDIIKNLNDYNFNEEEKRFVKYLRCYENEDLLCDEKINNPEFINTYYSKKNDFVIYASGQPGNEAKRITFTN